MRRKFDISIKHNNAARKLQKWWKKSRPSKRPKYDLANVTKLLQGIKFIQCFLSSILSTNLFFEKLSNRFSFLVSLDLTRFLVAFFVVDLFDNTLLITHFGHHTVSTLKSFNQKVNSLVELVQVHFHVFFLTLKIFWFFITVEIFELIFILDSCIFTILRLLL